MYDAKNIRYAFLSCTVTTLYQILELSDLGVDELNKVVFSESIKIFKTSLLFK